MAALPPVVPVIVQENWAQCENPNCSKWRRLPPTHKVNEEEPWYCYLNPDADKATCSASEDEFNEATMIELGPGDANEAEQARLIRERLTASLLASTSGAVTAAAAFGAPLPASGGKGRGRGKGRGKGGKGGRGGGGGGGRGRASPDPYYSAPKAGGRISYKEESDEEFETDEDEVLPAPSARRQQQQQQQQQQPNYAPHFKRLLQNQGSWEGAGAGPALGAGGAAPYMAPPQEAWQGLGQHAPELAEVAAAAADVASSLQYFQDGAGGGAATDTAQAADSTARLSAMLAAAAALVATEDSLTAEDKRACCLDAAAAAPTVKLEPAGLPLAAQQPFGLPMQQQFQQPALAGGFPQAGIQQLPMQLGGAGMAGWPAMALVPPNGQQQQQQQQQFGMQMAQQQFLGLPGMQLGMQQPQFGAQPLQPLQPGMVQQAGGGDAAPMAHGVNPQAIAQYLNLMHQKPGSGGGAAPAQPNGTQH